MAKEYSASKLQQTFAQHQVQAPALVQHADQAAKTFDVEALNRQFQAQARQAQEKAQEKAQETARQAQQKSQQQQAPSRSQDGGISM